MPPVQHRAVDFLQNKPRVAGRITAAAENKPIEGILKSWNLFDGQLLNNAAVFLFAKNVLALYTQCHF